jgi:hypothetical protein
MDDFLKNATKLSFTISRDHDDLEESVTLLSYLRFSALICGRNIC